MRIVIMGGGKVGLNLASFLISDGQDVALIESNDKKSTNVARELDATVIKGTGTDTKALEAAGIQDADVFVAATENDEANLLACLLVKDHNVGKIIARVSDYHHTGAFREAGIDYAVSPELTTASYLEEIILRPKIVDLVVLGRGDAELLDITVESEKFDGRRIGDISPTKQYIIVAVYENGNIMIPMADMVLKKGTKISILVKTESVKKILDIFT